MNGEGITRLLTDLCDIQIFTLIFYDGQRTRVVHGGATSDVLPVIRGSLKEDSLLRAACCDVVEEAMLGTGTGPDGS